MKLFLQIAFLGSLAVFLSCQNRDKSKDSQTVNLTIPVDEFEGKLVDGIQLIDVRSAEEFQQGHLRGALNYDVNSAEFESQLSKLDKNKVTLVYCLSGGRSESAAGIMEDKGFVEVYNMQGGIMKWYAANKAIEEGPAAVEQMGMNEVDFNHAIAASDYVLVDYNAKWCKPCVKMAPMLQAFSEKNKEKLALVKIDADENRTLLKKRGIESIPVLELYKGGKLVWKHEGEIDETSLNNEIKL